MKRIDAGRIAAVLLACLALASPAVAARNTPSEAANKKLVADFYQALDTANSSGTTAKQARAIAERFLSPNYVQHKEGVIPGENGRENFIRGAEAAPPGPLPPAMRVPAKTIALMAEGDRVIIVTSRDIPTPAGIPNTVYIFNMFRIANGKLAEHWDALPSAMTKPQTNDPERR